MKIKVENIGEELRDGLGVLQTGRVAALDQARNGQIAMRALLQNEARRIEKKYGDEHPRSRRLTARLQSNLAAVRSLEVEREIVRIAVPDVGPEEALVHGRIFDQRGRGIAGLAVCLTDSRGQPIPNLASATSDPRGYYALVLDGAAFEILKSLRAGPFLAVFGSDGRAVYRSKEALTIEPGARLMVEVALLRQPPTPGGAPIERRPTYGQRSSAPSPPKAKAKRSADTGEKAARGKRKK